MAAFSKCRSRPWGTLWNEIKVFKFETFRAIFNKYSSYPIPVQILGFKTYFLLSGQCFIDWCIKSKTYKGANFRHFIKLEVIIIHVLNQSLKILFVDNCIKALQTCFWLNQSILHSAMAFLQLKQPKKFF